MAHRQGLEIWWRGKSEVISLASLGACCLCKCVHEEEFVDLIIS